jgi:hypothetical protein
MKAMPSKPKNGERHNGAAKKGQATKTIKTPERRKRDMSRQAQFPKPVQDRLAKAVGFRCSNPECRKPTTASGEKGQETIVIGEAAHIYAKSNGGPRAKAELSAKQRKDYANGIWLCRNCHRIVDTARQDFPVEKLQKWKQEAEEKARKELTGEQEQRTEKEATREIYKIIADLKIATTRYAALAEDPDQWEQLGTEYANAEEKAIKFLNERRVDIDVEIAERAEQCKNLCRELFVATNGARKSHPEHSAGLWYPAQIADAAKKLDECARALETLCRKKLAENPNQERK